MDQVKQNLRELISSKGITITFLAAKLGQSVSALSRKVDGLRQLNVAECRILAEWLHVSKEAVVDAATETAARPGEGDPRGRKGSIASKAYDGGFAIGLTGGVDSPPKDFQKTHLAFDSWRRGWLDGKREHSKRSWTELQSSRPSPGGESGGEKKNGEAGLGCTGHGALAAQL